MNHTLEFYADQFHRDGYLKLENMFNIQDIEELHDIAISNFHDAMSYISCNNLEIGIGVKHGFKEIVQRHRNRFEMSYKMDNPLFLNIVNNSGLLPLVIKLLGEDYIIANQSLVISLPGAETQSWHIDGPHIDPTQHLQCHVFNVFVPLVDVGVMNGPTEIRPQSHFITRDLSKQYLAAFISKRLCKPVAHELSKGSALLFDYRTLHRGKANNSEEPRPVLVITFSKSWYKASAVIFKWR